MLGKPQVVFYKYFRRFGYKVCRGPSIVVQKKETKLRLEAEQLKKKRRRAAEINNHNYQSSGAQREQRQ